MSIIILSSIENRINQLVAGMFTCTLRLMIVCVAVRYTVVSVSECWHASSDPIVL